MMQAPKCLLTQLICFCACLQFFVALSMVSYFYTIKYCVTESLRDSKLHALLLPASLYLNLNITGKYCTSFSATFL